MQPQAPDRIYGVGDAGFFATSDLGNSWEFANKLRSPLAAISKLTISPVSGGPAYISVGGAVYYSVNSKEADSWKRSQHLPALTVNDVVADVESASKAYAAVHLPNRWSIFRTTDAGQTWQATMPPPKLEEKFLSYTSSLDIVGSNGHSIIYAGTNLCGVLHSENEGQTWDAFGRQDCFLSNNEPKNVLGLAADPSITATVYVAADKTKVYTSADKGKTWRFTELPIAGAINTIKVDPSIKDRVYLIAGSDGFWRSDDGAKNWQKYSNGLEEKLLIDCVVVPNLAETLFIASSDGGVWKTTDGGNHWTSIRESLATTTISTLAYDGRTQELLLGSWQDGIYRFQPGSLANIWH